MGSRAQYSFVRWQFIQVAGDFSKHVVPYTRLLLACRQAKASQAQPSTLGKSLDYATRLRQTGWAYTGPETPAI